jgi:type I restriction-modification system DNA methylase subunit
MLTKDEAQQRIAELVEKYASPADVYENADYNEARTRQDFINPLFKTLGWDMDNEKGVVQYLREVILEDRVSVDGRVKHPDYSFRLGNTILFYVEAKKPSVSIKNDSESAFQLRRYAWNTGLTMSLLTNFREFAVYDCRVKPNVKDKAPAARLTYFTYQDLTEKRGTFGDQRDGFDFLWDTFTQENISKGSFEKFIKDDGDRFKRGVLTVDKDFLQLLDTWRERLAKSLVRNNSQIDEEELNLAIQQFLDRLVFLRVAEDRGIEQRGTLKSTLVSDEYYKNLYKIFVKADQKYNSGLYDFEKDKISKRLAIDNSLIKQIITDLYDHNPYDFALIPVGIFGMVYEQFLGKTIRLTPHHRVKIEEKPEVREAGGVYYTPQYIVDYIVENTVGKLLEGKTPKEVEKIKIVDPACGSGGFLLGAYQYLLDWHAGYYKAEYQKHNKKSRGLKTDPITPDGKLSAAVKKQILLNNIFGVDIDVTAVEITKWSLLIKCLEGETAASVENTLIYERVLPPLDDNILDGNSLIDTDFYDLKLKFGDEKKVKPFNWQKAFPAVFQQGGFDAVIGNPPWVSLKGKFGHSIDENMANYFITKYQGNTRMPNLYEYFVHRCLALINDRGHFSFIVPDRLGYNKQFIALRKKILEDYRIEELLYKAPFPGIIADTLIFRFGKKSTSKDGKTFFVGEYQHPLQQKSASEYLADVEYRFQYEIDERIASVLHKIFTNDRCRPLASIVQTTSGVGAHSSAITEKRKNQRQIEIVRGRSIQKYVTLKAFFFEFKSENITGRTVDRSKLGIQEKVLLRKTGFPIFATYDTSGIYPEQSLYFLFSSQKDQSLKYITAILNSKLFQFVYYNRLITTKDSTPYLKKVDLDRFPLYVCEGADKAPHDLIVQYVDNLLHLYKRKSTLSFSQQSKHVEREIEHYEEQIDKLIYKLYALTAAEIAIVEGELWHRKHKETLQ